MVATRKSRRERKTKAAKAATKAANPTAIVPAISIDNGSLWAHIDHLKRLIDAKVPADGPLIEEMGLIASNFEMFLIHSDDEVPDPGKLRTAYHRFYDLPIEKQRMILNGWAPDPTCLMKEADDWPDAHRFLEIDTDRDGATSHHQTILKMEPDDPVRVLVREGTSKRQVLDRLYAIIERISADWDSMIDEIARD